MYPVLKIMHMLNFLDTFSMGITINTPKKQKKCLRKCKKGWELKNE